MKESENLEIKFFLLKQASGEPCPSVLNTLLVMMYLLEINNNNNKYGDMEVSYAKLIRKGLVMPDINVPIAPSSIAFPH